MRLGEMAFDGLNEPLDARSTSSRTSDLLFAANASQGARGGWRRPQPRHEPIKQPAERSQQPRRQPVTSVLCQRRGNPQSIRESADRPPQHNVT